MISDSLDPVVFGQRLRYMRKRTGMTLEALGALVGSSASYLSQLENGHREPRLSTVNQLASALKCKPAELLSSAAPNRRAELEVSLARIQDDPLYKSLRLPYLKPSARLDGAALEHIVTLFGRMRELSEGSARVVPENDLLIAGTLGARAANAAMRDEMRRRDNYFEEIEAVATDALEAVGYSGPGAVSERHLADAAQHLGFTIARVQGLPPSTRSITDIGKRVVYVPQRNATGGTRSSRTVIAQTLGHFALGHAEPADFASYVRQRVEAN